MTCRLSALKTLALAVTLLFGFALRGRAQSTEGYVDIWYDDYSGGVYAVATTYPDYSTLYYYVPRVHVWFMKEHDYQPINVWLGEQTIVGETHGGYGCGYALASVFAEFEAGVPYSAFADHSVDIYFYDEGNSYWYDFYAYSMLPAEDCEECHWDPVLGMYVCNVCEYRTWTPPQIPTWVYFTTVVLGDTGKEDVEPEGPPILEVRNGGELVNEDQTVYISAGSASSPPQMPALTAKLLRVSPPLGYTNWKIHISYNGHGRPDSDYFPSEGGTTLPGAYTWDIGSNFGSSFRGGTATLYYQYNATGQKWFNFHIGGINPSGGDALSKLGSSPWFLTRLARQESSLLQFSGSDPLAHDDPGGSVGFGLMMITNPPATSQQIWNWQANVEEGKTRVGNFNTYLTGPWNGYKQAWELYNAQHPGQEVPAPGPRYEASCQFVWKDGGSGSEGEKSLRDAAWIKRYNGIPGLLDFVMWSSSASNWVYNPTGNGRNYVNDVCSQQYP